MIPLPVFVWTCAVGVVDRVEGELAVVEWSPDRFGHLPVALDPDLVEGRVVRACRTRTGPLRIRVRPRWRARPRLPPTPADLPDAIDLASPTSHERTTP